ncbi:MAG: DEAD/DEAH box helicase, partial [Bacteroidales bacterium]|nr:DEAD/DEAH box helicase [Bacteroidales bacterium]
MNNILDSEIKFLPGVGPRRAELLSKELGIDTFRDMMYTFPFRYVDRSHFYAVRDIDGTGVYVQLRGVIRSIKEVGAGKAKRLVASFCDDTGSVDLIFFKGIKWVAEKLKEGSEYVIFGKPSFYNGSYNFVHPEVDSINTEMNRTSSMIGIYSSTEKLQNAGITNKVFSKLQMNLSKLCAGKIQETMPSYILSAKNLCPLPEALFNIHFPQNIHALYAAQRRLKYEELFLLQLSLLKQKCVRMRENDGVIFKKVGENFNYTYDHLSFPLTNAQKRVLKEIRADVVSGKQMNRLLQGDVGSGKTLVAVLSALQAIDNGYQACIMAPTEVLANQHFASVSKFVDTDRVKVALLTGSTKPKEKKEIYERLESGTKDLVIGTQALIEDKVKFASLGLAV